MKILKIIALIFVFLTLNISVYSQDATATPERTPEQEAAKQTEKLQQELNLSSEQARQVHEINLRYARARKLSNTRADALQRIKDKEAELKKILNPAQYTQLLNKRFERSSFQTPSGNRNLPANSFRPATDSRTQQINRDQNPGNNPRTAGSGTEVRRVQLPVSRDGYNRPATNTQPRTATPSTQQSTPAGRNTQPASSTPRTSGSNNQGGSSSGSGSSTPTRNQGSSDGSGSRSTSGSSTTNRR